MNHQNRPNHERRKNQPSTADEHMENQAAAAKATKDNDLTTGHSYKGDGGDNNAEAPWRAMNAPQRPLFGKAALTGPGRSTSI